MEMIWPIHGKKESTHRKAKEDTTSEVYLSKKTFIFVINGASNDLDDKRSSKIK